VEQQGFFNVLSVSLGTAPAHVGETMQRMNPSSPVDDQLIVRGKKKKREFKLVLLGCLSLCELWRPDTLQGLACNSSVSLKVHMWIIPKKKVHMCQAH
jgi:hypothetical protein